MKKKLFTLIFILIFTNAFSQKNNLQISRCEKFYSNGSLLKRVIKENIAVVASLEETNDYGRFYRVYLSIYNNTEKQFDVLTKNIVVKYKHNKKTLPAKILTLKKYKNKAKSKNIAYELILGDFDNFIYGKNPSVQRTITTRKRNNKGGGADTVFMNISKVFRNEKSVTTKINYGSANRMMMREVANNSDLANGINGIMSEEYFTSNTLNKKEPFTSGYFVFKRKNADKIELCATINNIPFIFIWSPEELEEISL